MSQFCRAQGQSALDQTAAMHALTRPAYHTNKKLIRKATLEAIAPTVAP